MIQKKAMGAVQVFIFLLMKLKTKKGKCLQTNLGIRRKGVGEVPRSCTMDVIYVLIPYFESNRVIEESGAAPSLPQPVACAVPQALADVSFLLDCNAICAPPRSYHSQDHNPVHEGDCNY